MSPERVFDISTVDPKRPLKPFCVIVLNSFVTNKKYLTHLIHNAADRQTKSTAGANHEGSSAGKIQVSSTSKTRRT